MKIENLFDTFELLYAILLSMYNNLFYQRNSYNEYSENQELFSSDIIEEVVFNEIYKDSEKLDNFEKNNINRESFIKNNSMNLLKESVDKELFSEENSMNLLKESVDKELSSATVDKELSSVDKELSSVDKELYIDSLYSIKNNEEINFWNNYFQNE